MGNITEKLALGEISVHGKFEIVTKNDLTGRVHQRVSEENTVHEAFYSYLRQAALDAMTNSVSNMGAPPPVFGVNKTFQYCSPFNQVMLTDGTLASGSIDPNMGIDGNILALGSDTTSATAGTIYGISTASEWFAYNHSVYKRWDWGSANGNGTFSKILTTAPYMRSGNRLLPSVASGLDFFVKSVPTVSTSTGYVCGGQANDLWIVYSISTNSLVLRRISLTASGLAQTDYTFSSTSPTFSTSQYENYQIYHSTADPNIVYFIVGYQTTQYVCKLNISTLAFVSKTTISTPYMYSPYGYTGYIDSSDNIYFYGYTNNSGNYGLWRYIYTASTATVDGGTKLVTMTTNITMPFSSYTKWGYTSGDNVYLYHGQARGISSLNLSTGEHTVAYLSTSKLNAEFDYYTKRYVYYSTYTGDIGLLKYNGHYYSVLYYTTSPGWQLARCIDNLLPDFLVTTSKLLSSTVTKTSSQSMYIGYTLEFS